MDNSDVVYQRSKVQFESDMRRINRERERQDYEEAQRVYNRTCNIPFRNLTPSDVEIRLDNESYARKCTRLGLKFDNEEYFWWAFNNGMIEKGQQDGLISERLLDLVDDELLKETQHDGFVIKVLKIDPKSIMYLNKEKKTENIFVILAYLIGIRNSNDFDFKKDFDQDILEAIRKEGRFGNPFSPYSWNKDTVDKIFEVIKKITGLHFRLSEFFNDKQIRECGLSIVDESLRYDYSIALKVISKYHANSYVYLSEEMKKNKNFIIAFLLKAYEDYKNNARQKPDEKPVIEILKTNPEIMKNKNIMFLIKAIREIRILGFKRFQNTYCNTFFNDDEYKESLSLEEIIFDTEDFDLDVFYFHENEILKDLENKKNIFYDKYSGLFNGQLLKYASSKLRNNKELVLKILEQDPNSISFISEELKSDLDIICYYLRVIYNLISNNSNYPEYKINMVILNLVLNNEKYLKNEEILKLKTLIEDSSQELFNYRYRLKIIDSINSFPGISEYEKEIMIGHALSSLVYPTLTRKI